MKAVKLPRLSLPSLPSVPKLRMPKQTLAVKAFFLSRAFREKILLLGFVILIVATWLSSVVGRTNRFTRAFGMTSRDLAIQQGWLAEQGRIEAAAKAAVEHLDPAKTFDGVRLQSEVAAIATRLGITTFSADNPVSEHASVFTKNTMQVTIRNVEYPALVKFYLEVVKQTPYIGFDQIRVSVNNGKHSATMRVTSVELEKR